jgi:hypothetical protein
MFLVKGNTIEHWNDHITSILSSVDMKKEALLVLFDNYILKDIDFKQINTINLLRGSSKDLLTDKYTLIKWFTKIKFHGNLPAIVLPTFDEKTVEEFLKRGTKYKFLKPSDEFKGTGIHVIDSVEEVKKAMETKESSKRSFRGWVLQDALEDIATIQRFKCHLRVLIVVVVRENRVSVFITNFYAYRLSFAPYNVTKLKDTKIYNSHYSTNSKTLYFPMDAPDGWTANECKKAMHQMKQDFTFIFKQQHAFYPDWKIKNGYELLGADVLFDTKRRPYIIEINKKPGFAEDLVCFIPEILHLGMGGAPMKLFSTLYGTPNDRITPFTTPLTTFYGTTYKNAAEVNDAFKSLFHLSLGDEADRAYFEYRQNSTRRTVRTKRNVTRKIAKKQRQ